MFDGHWRTMRRTLSAMLGDAGRIHPGAVGLEQSFHEKPGTGRAKFHLPGGTV
jgi:hypothetical protein